jgi:hypothetical protein
MDGAETLQVMMVSRDKESQTKNDNCTARFQLQSKYGVTNHVLSCYQAASFLSSFYGKEGYKVNDLVVGKHSGFLNRSVTKVQAKEATVCETITSCLYHSDR